MIFDDEGPMDSHVSDWIISKKRQYTEGNSNKNEASQPSADDHEDLVSDNENRP